MDRSYGTYRHFQAMNPLTMTGQEKTTLKKFEAGSPQIFILAGSQGHAGVNRLLQGSEQRHLAYRREVFKSPVSSVLRVHAANRSRDLEPPATNTVPSERGREAWSSVSVPK